MRQTSYSYQQSTSDSRSYQSAVSAVATHRLPHGGNPEA